MYEQARIDEIIKYLTAYLNNLLDFETFEIALADCSILTTLQDLRVDLVELLIETYNSMQTCKDAKKKEDLQTAFIIHAGFTELKSNEDVKKVGKVKALIFEYAQIRDIIKNLRICRILKSANLFKEIMASEILKKAMADFK